MTATRCAMRATSPMLWVMTTSDMPYASCSSSIRSTICAWMVTSRAVVGSSANSRRGLQLSAIAIITRWRMPPLI